jgi:hypothetical protein
VCVCSFLIIVNSPFVITAAVVVDAHMIIFFGHVAAVVAFGCWYCGFVT